MRINGINLNRLSPNRTFLRKQNPYFNGGYKDITDDKEKEAFDKQIKFYIKKIKHSTPFGIHKTKKVNVNGKPATLRIYKGKNYILSSKDKKIEAVMILSDSTSKDSNIRILYGDTDGKALFMDLLYSKGSGAGSFLVNEAVKQSKKDKYDGKIIVYAGTLNCFAGSSIPFYYNQGFKACFRNKQIFLEESMEKYNETGIYNYANIKI